MTRPITFLAALCAVVAGLGSGFVWLEHHVSTQVVVLSGLGLFCISGGLVAGELAELDKWPWPFTTPLSLLVGVGLGFLAGALEHNIAASYVYVAAAALPLVWIAYRRETRRYKKCPDCCEPVRVGARVCRYCRYAFRPPDPS